MAYGDMSPADYGFDTNFSNTGLTGTGSTGLSYGGNNSTSSFGGGLGSSLDQFQDYSSPGMQYGDYAPSNFSSPDLNSLFSGANYSFNGAEGSYGLGNNSVPGGPAAASAFNSFDDFMKSKLGQVARFAAGLTPLGRIANTAYSMSQATTGKQALNAAMGMVPGMAGGIARAATSDNPGRSMAQMAGGFGGSAIGGSLGGSTGAQIGGMLGSQLSGRMGLDGVNTQGDQVSPEGLAGNQGDKPFDVGGAASTLAQLYAMSQAGKGEKAAGQGNAAVQQQISQLNDMFSQNSPYAQALRQQLERKDAAAGRRSQYGPREVELQAQLAKMAAGNADTIGRLATSGQANQLALQKDKEQRRGQQLSTLLNLGKTTGAFDKLSSIFSGGNSSTPSLGVSNGSWDMPASNYDFPSTGSYGLGGGSGLGLRPSSNSFWD